VRKMMPLPGHPGAMPAAVAYFAAEAQGKGDEMAEALIAAPVEELTKEGCEKLAESLGLDMKKYRSAADSPDTRGRIHADIQDAKSVGLNSLPTIYIGREVFRDARATPEQIEAALRRAADAS
jgi:predicted DsbA family dithiol-disulfide isomerase